MLDTKEHLANLTRHIKLVQDATMILGQRLIDLGEVNFGIILIARGFVHDASKFKGIEWDYLHVGDNIPEDKKQAAIRQHVLTNDHHPEFWGGIELMPDHALAEMVCDWLARAQEFGTGLRDWVEQKAVKKWNINKEGHHYKMINKYVDLLLRGFKS